MKKLFALLIALFAFTACNDDFEGRKDDKDTVVKVDTVKKDTVYQDDSIVPVMGN